MLTLKNLVAGYGSINVLKDVNIEVKEGQVVTLLGSNGAGKTTTLRCISGLIKPESGSISFDGKDLTGLKIEEISKIGIIQSPEGRRIFSHLTVEENLLLGSYNVNDKKIIADTLKEVYGYFPRLEERKGQDAGTLSGGEQQMLAIGRALMGKPKLLILDEPSLGLAPLIVKEIFNIIEQLKSRGSTILLVEQNAIQALKVSDYAYVLETGKVVEEGEAQMMKDNPKIISAYLGAE